MRVFIYVDAQGAIGKDVGGWKFEPAEIFFGLLAGRLVWEGCFLYGRLRMTQCSPARVGWRGNVCICLNAGVGRLFCIFGIVVVDSSLGFSMRVSLSKLSRRHQSLLCRALAAVCFTAGCGASSQNSRRVAEEREEKTPVMVKRGRSGRTN